MNTYDPSLLNLPPIPFIPRTWATQSAELGSTRFDSRFPSSGLFYTPCIHVNLSLPIQATPLLPPAEYTGHFLSLFLLCK